MDARERIKYVSREICLATDSDDVAGIIKRALDELIGADVAGLQLRLFLKQLDRKLNKMLCKARDVIELNNLKRGIDMIEHFEEILVNNPNHYELN